MAGEDLVLIFGEDDNDRRALMHLVRALLPDGKRARIETRRRPIILSREARRRPAMSEEIAALWRVERQQHQTVVVVVHRDCDDVEPAHVAEAEALKRDLRSAGIVDVVAATPAWEIEAWWMLFPEALARVRRCWRGVDYSNQHVGRIRDAKKRLRRDLRPVEQAARKRCPDFFESDGVRVAEVQKSGFMERARWARSDSFECFKAEIQAMAASLR